MGQSTFSPTVGFILVLHNLIPLDSDSQPEVRTTHSMTAGGWMCDSCDEVLLVDENNSSYCYRKEVTHKTEHNHAFQPVS